MARLVLAEVREELDVRGSSDDKAIVRHIAAAESRIGREVGPLEPTTKTSRVRARGGAFVLPVTPVVSVTSATPVLGTPLDVDDLDVDLETGVVQAPGGRIPDGECVVVYQAGWTDPPADVLLAATLLVVHLWESTRTNGGSGDPLPGAAHSLPYRVTELLEPYLTGGFS